MAAPPGDRLNLDFSTPLAPPAGGSVALDFTSPQDQPKLVGLGEGPDDLAPFEAAAFVDALLG